MNLLGNISVFILTLFSVSAFSSEAAIDFIMAKRGSCFSDDIKIDMNDVYLISDTQIIRKNKDGYNLLEIQGENFYVGKYSSNKSFVSKIYTNVSLEIVEKVKSSKDMDVQLSFALVDGAVALHWRETFMHRIYNQGIFKINGTDLVYLCSGKGGSQSGH